MYLPFEMICKSNACQAQVSCMRDAARKFSQASCPLLSAMSFECNSKKLHLGQGDSRRGVGSLGIAGAGFLPGPDGSRSCLHALNVPQRCSRDG